MIYTPEAEGLGGFPMNISSSSIFIAKLSMRCIWTVGWNTPKGELCNEKLPKKAEHRDELKKMLAPISL